MARYMEKSLRLMVDRKSLNFLKRFMVHDRSFPFFDPYIGSVEIKGEGLG
jgi:hypothetical protein